MDTSQLLSDDFVQFSEEIKKLHEQKQAKKQQLKEFWEKIQAEIKVIDDAAAQLLTQFQASKGATNEQS